MLLSLLYLHSILLKRESRQGNHILVTLDLDLDLILDHDLVVIVVEVIQGTDTILDVIVIDDHDDYMCCYAVCFISIYSF